MPKYCIIITLTQNDSGAEFGSLLGLGNGETGLKDYVIGKDADESGQFQRWVLAFGGEAVTVTGPRGTPVEIDVVALFAYNADCVNGVQNRIGTICNARPALGRQLRFDPPLTRQQMVDRIKVEVGSEIAADHYWHCKPNDNVTTGINSGADLLNKFALVPLSAR